MAKLTDKFFNRVIEGPLEMEQSDVKSFEDKDLKVKTIEQSDYNWSIDLPLFSDFETLGLTQTRIFAKLVEINKVLYLVFEVNLANETESNITINGSVYYSSNIILPSEIADKIYDHAGKKVSENTLGEVTVTDVINGKYGFVGTNAYHYPLILQHQGANTVRLALTKFNTTPITINAGSSDALHGRTFVVL